MFIPDSWIYNNQIYDPVIASVLGVVGIYTIVTLPFICVLEHLAIHY